MLLFSQMAPYFSHPVVMKPICHCRLHLYSVSVSFGALFIFSYLGNQKQNETVLFMFQNRFHILPYIFYRCVYTLFHSNLSGDWKATGSAVMHMCRSPICSTC